MFDSAEIEEMFTELSLAQTGGLDPLTYAGQQTVQRWDEYEADRKWWRENDAAYRRERMEQWAKANSNRKKKRRGLHLSNEDRARLADDIREGRSLEDVSRETGVSVATAANIGQLHLL